MCQMEFLASREDLGSYTQPKRTILSYENGLFINHKIAASIIDSDLYRINLILLIFLPFACTCRRTKAPQWTFLSIQPKASKYLNLTLTFSTRESSYCFQRVLAIAILSVRLSVCLSVTRVDQSKVVQARITKSSPSAAKKTLVLGTIKLFHKFESGHPERKR